MLSPLLLLFDEPLLLFFDAPLLLFFDTPLPLPLPLPLPFLLLFATTLSLPGGGRGRHATVGKGVVGSVGITGEGVGGAIGAKGEAVGLGGMSTVGKKVEEANCVGENVPRTGDGVGAPGPPAAGQISELGSWRAVYLMEGERNKKESSQTWNTDESVVKYAPAQYEKQATYESCPANVLSNCQNRISVASIRVCDQILHK
jgi:hypothetical protein